MGCRRYADMCTLVRQEYVSRGPRAHKEARWRRRGTRVGLFSLPRDANHKGSVRGQTNEPPRPANDIALLTRNPNDDDDRPLGDEAGPQTDERPAKRPKARESGRGG
jgi:hypothetical protein